MASIRIKRKSTESAYGSTTTLLPGELGVAGKWLWYGPKETSTDDAQVQARPVYSPTTLGDSGSILISNGADLGWIKKGSERQILTSTKDGISWAAAPKQFSLSINGITYDGGSLAWYAPSSSGTIGQYLKSAGEYGFPTWVDFPVSITLNGTKTEEPAFYAPIGSGTSGQMLYSNGNGKAPTWKEAPIYIASTGLALSGTVFRAKLRSERHNASASEKSAATAGRLYAVEVDKDGYLSVTVPWTYNNTTYTAGDGINISNTHVISVKYATTTEVGGFIAGTYTGENDSKTTALVMAPSGLLDISIDCGTWA